MSNKIVGSVVSLSSTGGLVTDITADQLDAAPRDDSVTIAFGGHETFGLFSEDNDLPTATLVAILPDSGFLKIELTGISVSDMLGIQVGEGVEVSW